VDPRNEAVSRILALLRYFLVQSMALVPVIGLLATHSSHVPSIVLVSVPDQRMPLPPGPNQRWHD
jgi:hypothetical protein